MNRHRRKEILLKIAMGLEIFKDVPLEPKELRTHLIADLSRNSREKVGWNS
jgi:hypothetical protein